MKLAWTLIAAALLQGAASPTARPEAVQVAADVWEIASIRAPGRGPDGNTIIFDAPQGLIVVDTGRHVWQSDAILAFAPAQGRPIAAIVNTHWHLDHASGNVRLKAAFPRARVYTTSAIDRALADGGFLRRNYERALRQQEAGEGESFEREERQIFIDTMAHADFLRPDVTLRESATLAIAGRTLDVHVTDRAVSDADVWLYDPATRIAVLGDLVTLPAPFFETACPQQWRAELDRVWETPFEHAIPGHGAIMDRAQFDLYRTAFNAFVDCAQGKAEADRCVTIWSEGISSLEPHDVELHADAQRYAAYYVDFLRSNDGRSPDCLAP